MKKNTIIEVAKAAKVSPTTVSRVFGKHPYVSQDVKDRVINAARTLNYAPKFNATQKNFGLLVGKMHLDAFEARLIRFLSDELINNGYGVEILSRQSLPFLHKSSLCGILAFPTADESDILSIGIPSLCINNLSPNMPSVSTDHRQGLELAVTHLVKNGHTRIAYLEVSSGGWGIAEREQGYKESLNKHNIEFDPHIIKRFFHKEMFIPLAQVLKREPTALIIGGESYAQEASYCLYLLNKNIPDDISVIVFENPDVQYIVPPLTAIDQDFENMSKAIAQKALEMIKTPSPLPHFNILLENKLIERESVKNIS